MSQAPSTDFEWTIHSLNIHGLFFQEWCASVVQQSDRWDLVTTEYPVEFPPPNGPIRGKESRLDIRAQLRHQNWMFTILIECKKNNPEFVDWVFFATPTVPNHGHVHLAYLVNETKSNGRWAPASSIRPVLEEELVLGEARETRGTYSNVQTSKKTKTSNAAIADAAYQITIASQAIAREESVFMKKLSSDPNESPPWHAQLFLPIVVTSAKLYVCEFDPASVCAQTGELQFGDVTLREVPKLFFEYPIPKHLQQQPADLREVVKANSIELFVRKQIMIIHSGHFAEALEELARDVAIPLIERGCPTTAST